MRTLFILCLAASLCPAQDAAALFAKHCAGCHRPGSSTRAPLPEALKLLSKEKILGALEFGAMITQGAGLTAAERLSLATYLSAPSAIDQTEARTNLCPAATFSITPGESAWNGWGVDLANTRFQPAKSAGLDREKVARLKLKWDFGFPGQSSVLAQPVVAGGRLFFGSAAGA